MRKITMSIGRREVEILVLRENDPSNGNEETTIVAEYDNDEAVIEAAGKIIDQGEWRIRDGVLDDEPTQRYMLDIAQRREVELVVMGEALQYSQVQMLTKVLTLFWGRLHDHRMWNIKRVTIPARDEFNTKSGQNKRGQEIPLQARFKVFPTAFRETGEYRDCLPCTWLHGTIIHEATHNCLEEWLTILWNKDPDRLGWRTLSDAFIRMPGGFETRYVNLHPEQCPTSYARLQPDDDRADSVVAFLARGHLHPRRWECVSRVLYPQDMELLSCSFAELPRRLPELGTFTFRCQPPIEDEDASFRPMQQGDGTKPPPHPVYDLTEYLSLHANGDPG